MSRIVKEMFFGVTSFVPANNGGLPWRVDVGCTPFYVQHTKEEWDMLEDNWRRVYAGEMTIAEARKRFDEFANVIRYEV